MKNVGKYLYLIPFIIFGLMHFANGSQLTAYMPDWIPLKIVLVYIAGLGLVLAPVAVFINKKARLAMTLLGVLLVLFAVLIHLVAFMGGNEMEMGQVFKDLALAGAAFYMAGHLQD